MEMTADDCALLFAASSLVFRLWSPRHGMIDSPPSTKITEPLMNLISGWLSATMTVATSSVVVRRRCGLRRKVSEIS